VTVDTLCFTEDSVIGGEEEIVEKLKKTGIFVLFPRQQMFPE